MWRIKKKRIFGRYPPPLLGNGGGLKRICTHASARVVISSAAFGGKPQIARHRVVNGLLKEELEREGGIHALQLRTLTLEEEDRLLERARAEDASGKKEGVAKEGVA